MLYKILVSETTVRELEHEIHANSKKEALEIMKETWSGKTPSWYTENKEKAKTTFKII
jgi:hypothetical protein